MLEDTVIDDRFLVRERLARQGLVEIWEGLDREEGQTVWVKRWADPLKQELEFIENWRGQVISIRTIDDGHLPRILAFGRLPDGDLYQIEEPPRGTTLRRFAAARAPLPVVDSVTLLATVARAVGIGHREGVAHGGLTPETIWIETEPDGRQDAFVGNWESGEVIVALRNVGEAVPERVMRYLSPEQLGELTPPPTFASDVYALGTILYELLTGSLPTPGYEGAGYATRVLAEPTPPSRFNPDIPAPVERVVLRSLSRDPAQRPANAQALASALMQALTTPEPVPLPPPPVEQTEIVVVRRNLWRPAAIILAIIALCTLVSTLWALQQRNPETIAMAVVTPTETVRVVPNLVGPPYLNYNDAMRLAWNQGFYTTIVGYRDDPALPPGVVVQQCPAPGSPPEAVLTSCNIPGLPQPSPDSILVEVSSLPDPQVLRVVPDLYGQPAEGARTALEAGGLRLGTRRDAYDSLLPAGRIVEQNPRRGLAVPPGTSVDIIVSAGPPLTAQDQPSIPPPLTPTVDAYTPPVVSATPPVQEVQATATIAPTFTPDVADPPPTASATLPVPGDPGDDDDDETEPVEPEGPVQTVLLEDDFESGNVFGWEEQSDETVEAVIEDGAFNVNVLEAPTLWVSRTSRIFDDFTFASDLSIAEGTDDPESGAGIVFRLQDAEHFYFFEINGADSYRLRARNGTEWVTLIDWFPDAAILPAGTTNNLQVRAEEDRLTLFINGSQVAVTDILPEVSYLNGDVGLAVETSIQPMQVQFDNVLVAR